MFMGPTAKADSASAAAMANPSPLVPPVTKAVFPERSMFMEASFGLP